MQFSIQELKMEYLLNADKIVDICGVSRRTAQRWLRGESSPPHAYLRLLTLELTGRIMPAAWPANWRFNHIDLLEFETCYPAISEQHLKWFGHALAGWRTALELIPELRARIDYLADKLPKAEVVILDEYRARLDALERQGQHWPESLHRSTR